MIVKQLNETLKGLLYYLVFLRLIKKRIPPAVYGIWNEIKGYFSVF